MIDSQNKSKPIGVFDSGLGGLTSLRRLRELLPGEDIYYFGDTARVPYGGRSREVIAGYAEDDARFLLSKGVKALLVACNTVCSAAIDVVRRAAKAENVPVFEVVDAPALAAVNATNNRRVFIFGTRATVDSGAYEAAIRRFAEDNGKLVATKAAACSLFVPLVESGYTSPESELVRLAVREYTPAVTDFGADTLILGCTHYPLLSRAIKQALPKNILLIDSGAVAAEHCAASLRTAGLLRDSESGGVTKYFVTDSAEIFSEYAGRYLGTDEALTAEKVVLPQL
ncbi:MAG: glutamate racemase [Oscillospiraceae bacterium]|jgi:glutamate racemase|nr:glutamate racemase [Oscillospiraceae bacterium]